MFAIVLIFKLLSYESVIYIFGNFFYVFACNKEVDKSDVLNSKNLNYSILLKGELSGEEDIERQGMVLKNQDEFDDLSESLQLNISDLALDFDNEQVVVVLRSEEHT